jgi:hypothetical protein
MVEVEHTLQIVRVLITLGQMHAWHKPFLDQLQERRVIARHMRDVRGLENGDTAIIGTLTPSGSNESIHRLTLGDFELGAFSDGTYSLNQI